MKTHLITPQKVLNQIGRLKYFHDDRFDSRRNEIRWLQVEHNRIPIQHLASTLEGFSIVQLTDMHLRPFTQTEHIERMVTRVNALKPDLIVLTGDYVWHDAADILDLVPILAKLKAHYGIYAILGNHDIKTDPILISNTFEKYGIKVFRNEGRLLQIDDSLLYLAGIDDGWLGNPDIEKTMQNYRGLHVPVILLAHEPDMIDWYSDDTRISLQLSGHTHGGQIRSANGKVISPIKPYLGKKYVQGLYRVNQSWVYTSRGIGSTGIPLRKNCPPEITHIVLVHAYH